MQLSPTQQQRLFDLLQTAHLDQQYSLPLEINALPTGLKQIAIAIYFSDFVADTLHKYPNLFQQWLASPPQFSDCDNYQQRLREKLAEITDETQLYQILRHFRHHEMAKLSFCQSLNLASVEQIFRQLSALAEAIIVVTKDWLYEKLCAELGTPMNSEGEAQKLIILGMGKLGGRELNFSSDIDLIFTYPDHGETVGARRSIDNGQFFVRLGQRFIKALEQQTIDGFVYRVDMRLRPFGDAGALALSFASMEDYYQEQGRDWERYAMIKARIMGEDSNDINHRYLNQLLRPFVYRRYIDFSAIQSLRDMKQKINAEVRRRGLVDNIKLGAGGIREIEFIVQVFQLIRGGREKSLQQRELLAILPKLVELDLLKQLEANHLSQAYLFLRRVENVLQAINDQQTQLLPTNEQDKQRLVEACRAFTYFNQQGQVVTLEYPIYDWQSFYQILTQHQQNVREVFHHLIGSEDEKDEATESEWQDFLGISFNLQDVTTLLASLAIDNQEKIAEDLWQFKQDILRKSIGVRGRDVLEQLLPVLIDEMLAMEQAAVLVPRILEIIGRIATRTTYLELLRENPNSRTLLMKLCSASPFVARQIADYPLLLDELLNPNTLLSPPPFTQYQAELEHYLLRVPQEDEEQMIDVLRQFKLATQLRVAAADILGALPVMKVSDHLTYLAEAIIASVVNLAWRQVTQRFGTPDHLQGDEKSFLVVGYGKLGGIELGYKSDLDLVFLYDAPANGQTVGGKRSIDSGQFYLRLAQKINSIFNINTNSGILYEVDMRLRPSGSAGLLVSSIHAFHDYQQNEAWTWEKQALVRARAVYGETVMRQQFNSIRRAVLSTAQDQQRLKNDVREMREKMYEHLSHTPAGYFDIKKDRGGITDIEFIAQYLMLANAPTTPELATWSDNVRIFEDMVKYQVISAEIGQRLTDIYVELRNHIHHLNLAGKNSVVEEMPFAEMRTFIGEVWQQLFD
ncbi:bifunctional [glutamate--ammonia ligase]-adenylyl-L-tyrosine phosphorylase/[glutamate--ammonia-ligase] adenylyltransferase [Gallibacterium sp. AGMB14963]|uniref:bifunctional [glutamate--ammonia ligase]-adenylyl-L-tyrosine phosphorylase/[glutamate--ammonia-ligase] adenylyltransferase n=1 Tax=Gallibacterium faecale TaxID=3019086 RepID=UPI0022F1C7B0|nr:bifunctional [glutamate--ammonia ligase]-adenylyl-L-tyrosine phosphorylase/[glutamate--ammonia-ligase] adenylyltransferase [Gallibacterium sp. AGMB14963]MDA3979128.1 bifunctional [glutamate--ammonia ligase]-adenylyl-L-tyrosine phosphorylase/[glutamate--ammonia-ligase] adenylyltransferase [Gallibacterium sp. AGMB14963]